MLTEFFFTLGQLEIFRQTEQISVNFPSFITHTSVSNNECPFINGNIYSGDSSEYLTSADICFISILYPSICRTNAFLTQAKKIARDFRCGDGKFPNGVYKFFRYIKCSYFARSKWLNKSRMFKCVSRVRPDWKNYNDQK